MKKNFKILLCLFLALLTFSAIALPGVLAAQTTAKQFEDNAQEDL